MTDRDGIKGLLEAIHLAQKVLGKSSARDTAGDTRPIWTALDWCETWFEAESEEEE